MNCIFCSAQSHESKSVEHVIPESLGNKEYVLPAGVVCDKCNGYFGRKIEQPLLEIPFFKQNRHRNNIFSKNGNIPPDIGFMISPDTGVEFKKDKHGEHLSLTDPKAIKKLSTRKKVAVLTPIFGFFNTADLHVSKFLAKLAIEALALQAHQYNADPFKAVDHEFLSPLKKFARNAKQNEFWPYTIRQLYNPEAGVQHPVSKEFYKIISSIKLIETEQFLFHQFLLCGVEFSIDMLNPSTHWINEWFRSNEHRSPVLENAFSYVNKHG